MAALRLHRDSSLLAVVDNPLLTGKTVSLLHPLIMFGLLGSSLYTGVLGWKWREARLIPVSSSYVILCSHNAWRHPAFVMRQDIAAIVADCWTARAHHGAGVRLTLHDTIIAAVPCTRTV